jgi:hypothetical protein
VLVVLQRLLLNSACSVSHAQHRMLHDEGMRAETLDRLPTHAVGIIPLSQRSPPWTGLVMRHSSNRVVMRHLIKLSTHRKPISSQNTTLAHFWDCRKALQQTRQ